MHDWTTKWRWKTEESFLQRLWRISLGMRNIEDIISLNPNRTVFSKWIKFSLLSASVGFGSNPLLKHVLHYSVSFVFEAWSWPWFLERFRPFAVSERFMTVFERFWTFNRSFQSFHYALLLLWTFIYHFYSSFEYR